MGTIHEPQWSTTMIATLPTPTVRLLVCGQADRGDDGVALAAAATLLPALPPNLTPRLEVRRCPELTTDDLIDIRESMQVLILDTVLGPTPGEIVRIPLDGLDAHLEMTLRSTRELPVDLLIGLAAVLRKQPVHGVIVAMGGHRFGYGTPLSRSTRAALPAYRAAILEELERLVDAPCAGGMAGAAAT